MHQEQGQGMKQLEIRDYNVKQTIDNFTPPPLTWYRDIGGKYSHIEIIVGLNSNYPLKKDGRIDISLSCHYESGDREEIHSNKPIFTIIEYLSRLKIDDAGPAIISLRFEQLSTRHRNEVGFSHLTQIIPHNPHHIVLEICLANRC